MYIKSICLDGFKSYGQRIEVNGFDPQFNAITGLNGSGKSNILDAICFVLGITNLNHVRVQNLQDLIYKKGQAGVNSATVSITFDNTNRDHCPPGYEPFKEIVVTRQVMKGGKNKYTLNGAVTPNKKVQDLFCSIQLNVNNPHFLIMQGKVTKVLNMKPMEILSMIEEAAGIKMYETKKEVVYKIIDAKNAKLEEIRLLFHDEIMPKLEKLKREKSKYLEFLKVDRELSEMTVLYKLWMIVEVRERSKVAKQRLDDAKQREQQMILEIDGYKNQIVEIDREVEDMQKTADEESNQLLATLENKVREETRTETKMGAELRSTKEQLELEKKNRDDMQKTIVDDQKLLDKKQKEMDCIQNKFMDLKKTAELDNKAFFDAQKRYEALSVGMEVNDEGEAETLRSQLMKAQQEEGQIQIDSNETKVLVNLLQEQLNNEQKQVGAQKADYQDATKELTGHQTQLKRIQQEIGRLKFDEVGISKIREQIAQIQRKITPLRHSVSEFEMRHPHMQFIYRDPETNFDRRQVHGMVCKLIRVKDPKFNVGIESAAGGKLYNVVVNSELVAKKILERGKLTRRYTFLPLNKIQGRVMTNRVIQLAQNLEGSDCCQPALKYLEFDQVLLPVMNYIFGNVFICSDIYVAKRIAFHPQIMTKCVTLDGDEVDPSGTMSGGSVKRSSVMAALSSIIDEEMELKKLEDQLSKLHSELQQWSVHEKRHIELRQQIELKQHEIALSEKCVADTSYGRCLDKINSLKEQIVENQNKIKELASKKQIIGKKIAELQTKIRTYNRDEIIKEAQTAMNKLKNKADKSNSKWQQHEQDFETLKLEISELTKGIETTRSQLEAQINKIEHCAKELHTKQANFEDFRKRVQTLQKELSEEKKRINANNKQIQKKLHEKDKLSAKITDVELEIRKHVLELKKLIDECKNNDKRLTDAMQEHGNDDTQNPALLEKVQGWSVEEGKAFERRLRETQQLKKQMERTVNAKAQLMMEKEEQVYRELSKKQQIVEQDRIKLLGVIKDFDRQRSELLTAAHNSITRDFNKIFGTLLPGAEAELKPPESKTISDGLEIRVALGGVWRKGLSELSGGQRSLAALSLILSMLQFKPAPIYILDEVDAALDLSHTQNIGQIIKGYFSQSQFVIVSLKDGMFNNANVLFRTKFHDGNSSVTRVARGN